MTEKKKRELFCRLIEGKWVTSLNPPPNSSNTKSETDFEEYSDDDEEAQVIAYVKDSVDANGGFIDQQHAYDNILNAEVALQLYEKVVAG